MVICEISYRVGLTLFVDSNHDTACWMSWSTVEFGFPPKTEIALGRVS